MRGMISAEKRNSGKNVRLIVKRALVIAVVLTLAVSALALAAWEMPRFLFRGTPLPVENQQALERALTPALAEGHMRAVVTVSVRVIEPSTKLAAAAPLTPRAARTR